MAVSGPVTQWPAKKKWIVRKCIEDSWLSAHFLSSSDKVEWPEPEEREWQDTLAVQWRQWCAKDEELFSGYHIDDWVRQSSRDWLQRWRFHTHACPHSFSCERWRGLKYCHFLPLSPKWGTIQPGASWMFTAPIRRSFTLTETVVTLNFSD